MYVCGRYQRATEQNLRKLRQRGAVVVEPVVKKLACGDTGKGAMAKPLDIVEGIMRALEAHEAERQEALEAGLPVFVP